jgi:VCBS repeat-containing protein
VDTNDVLTYTVVNAPDPETEGTVAVNGGQFTFYPAESLNGLAVGETVEVTFRYSASDGDAADYAEVTITVEGTNDIPEVGDIRIDALESQAAQQIDLAPFITDVDSDDDASTLNYNFVQPARGQLVDLGDGVLEFRPNGQFEDLAEGEVFLMNVALTVQDSHGAVVVKNMQIAVTGENDAPIADLVSVNAFEDSSMNFALPINDIDGDNLTVTFINPPAELTLSATGANASVTPNSALQSLDDGETAVFNVTYTVSDGIDTVQNVATITVQGNNDVPVINSIELSVSEDTVSVTQAFGGTDIEGDQIIYLIQTPPVDSDGFVTINNLTGEFTFTVGDALDSLQVGETKVVQFTYVATDGKDTSNAQTVQITVQGQNDAPVIGAVSHVMGEDDGTQIFSLNVSDVDNAISELTFSLDVEPTNADVVLNSDGTFSVTPGAELQALNDGDTALIEFTYSVNDGDNIVSQTAQITVTGSTDAPVVNSAFFEDPIQAVERFEYNFDINDAFANLLGGETVTFTDEFGGAAPSFIRYDEQTGKVIVLTGVSDFGEYNIQIHLTDGAGTNITQQFTLFVNEIATSLDANAIITGSGNDVINGTALGEYISSDGGEDTIIAGDGNDLIYGGSGRDYMVGGDGNDMFLLEGSFINDDVNTYHGGEGYDTIVLHSGGSKTMYIDGTFDGTSSIEEIRSTTDGIGSIRGSGNADTIDLSTIHLEGSFRIYGGSGNDMITGSAGDDTLIYGQAGNDTIDGYLGNDTLRGDAGNDTLYGGEGHDHLTGGTGIDSMYGGAGNDTLVWDSEDAILDGGVGDFDILDLTGQASVDFTTEPANEVNFEAIDMSGSTTEITLGLADVLEIRDTSVDTLYIMANNGDNVVTNGEFEVTTQVNAVDTNGDGNTDSTFQVYRSTLQSDVFIGLEIGVGLSLDGTLV